MCNQTANKCLCAILHRGGVAGPAGPAKAGTLFSGSLVSFPACRDTCSLRTRRSGQVSHANSPLPCVRVSRNRSCLFAGRSGAWRSPTRLHQHPRVAKFTCVYDVQLLAIWRIPLLAVVLLKLRCFLYSCILTSQVVYTAAHCRL